MLESPFPRDEYEARMTRVRAEMARQNVDGLLLTSGPNLTYLTGYPSPVRAGSRPFVAIFPLAGDPIFLVHTGRELEARGYSWIPDVRTYSLLSRAPVPEALSALHDLSLMTGTIGAELGPDTSLDLPVVDFLMLQERLPGARFVDVGPVLWPLRMRKSEAEVAYVRQACAATATAFERTFAAARGGMTETEVARLMNVASMDAGGSNPWVIITGGEGSYDLASKLPSRRRLEPGDFVWMDAGCTFGGYWSDFGRAGVVGGPTPQQRDAQARIHEITMLGVEMIAPGITTGEVARRCNEALTRLDFPITSCISALASRVGHGLGLVTTELPHLAEEDETVLELGMILTVEPGVATAYGTFHVEENVLVTEQGHELLSHAPRELATIALA